MKPRTIFSAMKKSSDPPDKRLKSAVQFKGLDIKKLNDSFKGSRVQSAATVQTAYTYTNTVSTLREVESASSQLLSQHVPRVKSAMKPRPFYRQSSQDSVQKITANTQEDIGSGSNRKLKLVVNAENVDSQEIQRRMKFDPAIRLQVQNYRILAQKDIALKSFLVLLRFKEKHIIEACKKNSDDILDLLQEVIELAIGTKNSKVLIRCLYFCGCTMEALGKLDFAVYFYNQTRIMANHAKLTLEYYKMKAYIGLASCCSAYEQYENSIEFLKKCLQYAWYNNDLDMENEVYDKLGFTYYYLGNMEKSYFYHDRAITYDYELEHSPLRTLSCENLKIFLSKYYQRNYAQSITVPLLNKMNIPLPNDLIQSAHSALIEFADSFGAGSPFQQPRKFTLTQNAKVFRNLQISGPKLIKEILDTNEFHFQVYTPKHSFKSESKCFEELKRKTLHPQDIYHDPKYKNNTFNITNLGVFRSQFAENPLEDTTKYKLPLDQMIKIRLNKNLTIDTSSKHYAASCYGSQYEKRNKILVTHKNTENEKRHRSLNEAKRVIDIEKQLKELIAHFI